MTIDFPASTQIPALRRLWQQAFGDTDAFLDVFFETAFSPDRSRCVILDGQAVAALYWFDCELENHRYAYLYAVATDPAYQNRGLCKALLEDTHRHLLASGYTGAVLVPGEESLFRFYEKAGYRPCGSVNEFTCTASEPSIGLQPIDAATYAALRRKLLPSGGLLQEGATLSFLNRFSSFYTGDGFLLAATKEREQLTVHEYLGDPALAPAITAALGAVCGRFRCPGTQKSFAMCHPFMRTAPTPTYLGLALD